MPDLDHVSFYFTVDEPIVETDDGFIYLTSNGQARFHDLAPDGQSPLPSEEQFAFAQSALRQFHSLPPFAQYGHYASQTSRCAAAHQRSILPAPGSTST